MLSEAKYLARSFVDPCEILRFAQHDITGLLATNISART